MGDFYSIYTHLLSAHSLDDLIESRFVDRQVVAVPSGDLLHGEVNHSYLYTGTFEGYDSHGGSTDITGTHTANMKIELRLRFDERDGGK